MEEKKNNKGLVWLIVILIILVLGLVGYIVYDKVILRSNNIKKEQNELQNCLYRRRKCIVDTPPFLRYVYGKIPAGFRDRTCGYRPLQYAHHRKISEGTQ